LRGALDPCTMARMTDTHAHVHDPAFDTDRDEMLRRAREAGIGRIVTVGCSVDDSRRAIACARDYGLRATVGIHPHEAASAPDDLTAVLSDLAADETVVAIGETGLDYHYDFSPRDVQQRVLRAQIRFARNRDLPLVFHHREAFDDFVTILREEFSPPLRGVVHCFTGDRRQARTLTQEFGLLLGIGGVLTFKNAQPLRDAVRDVGLQSLVLETDCPYLAPVPLRGQRNEPAFVVHTARALADLIGMPLDDVVAVTDANARTLFGL